MEKRGLFWVSAAVFLLLGAYLALAACPHGVLICGLPYNCGVNDGVCPEDYQAGICREATCFFPDPDCPGYAPTGIFESATCNLSVGWANDSDCANPINVQLAFDPGPTVISRTVNANIFRADVGSRVFSYSYDQTIMQKLCDGNSHTISATALGVNTACVQNSNNVELTASPRTVSGCGYYKANGGLYACCPSNSYCLNSTGKCQSGTEAIATGTTCNLNTGDEDCDGYCNYDNSTCSHGDNGCAVGVTAISVTSTTPQNDTTINITCTVNANSQTVNSIYAYIDENNNGAYDSATDRICPWNNPNSGWILSNTQYRFTYCNVGHATGNKRAACGVYDGSTTEPYDKSYQSGPDVTQSITVSSSSCFDYTTQATCPAGTCQWVAQCLAFAPAWSGGIGRCIPAAIPITYSCNTPACPATDICDVVQANSPDCTQAITTQCEPGGMRNGTRDALGNCNSTCGCELDVFTYSCVAGTCGASCSVNADCGGANICNSTCQCQGGCAGTYLFQNGDQPNIAWPDNVSMDTCCANPSDCVNINRACITAFSASSNFNVTGADNYAVCSGRGAGLWIDADSTQANCTATGLNWTRGGESSPFGEYDTGTSLECCRDDRGEFIRRLDFYTSGAGRVNWANVTNDDACCNAVDDCVYNHTCYTRGVILNLTGKIVSPDLIVRCNSTPAEGKWADVDSAAGTCIGAGLSWIQGGEAAPFGEFNPGTATSCCGDDADEYNITMTGQTRCCNNASDYIDVAGNCRQREAPGEITCNDNVDNDVDGLIDGCDSDCKEGAGMNPASVNRCCDESIFTQQGDQDANGVADADDWGCSDFCQGIHSSGRIMKFDNTTNPNNYFGTPYGVDVEPGAWEPYNGLIAGECCGDDPGEYYKNITVAGVTYHACCNSSAQCVDQYEKICQTGLEETFGLCLDGKDNDCDGMIDGADSLCTGNITGYVRDGRGLPVVGAIVKGSPPSIGAQYEVQTLTDASGYYKIETAIIGQYPFIARKEGYDDNVTITSISPLGETDQNFVLKNGSCHSDCTDFYGNCNPACEGVYFGGSERCQFINESCYNRPKDFVVRETYMDAGVEMIREYLCCEGMAGGTIRSYQAYKPTVTGDVENLYDYVRVLKLNNKTVRLHIAVWNPR